MKTRNFGLLVALIAFLAVFAKAYEAIDPGPTGQPSTPAVGAGIVTTPVSPGMASTDKTVAGSLILRDANGDFDHYSLPITTTAVQLLVKAVGTYRLVKPTDSTVTNSIALCVSTANAIGSFVYLSTPTTTNIGKICN